MSELKKQPHSLNEQTRREAWQRELAFIRARLTQNLPQRRLIWNRDSLYDERLPSDTRGR